MQIAFLSDIHGNLAALETVLADIESQGIETVVCLGDVIGYGPDPAACVRLVSERCVVSVLGNHEAMLVYAGLDLLLDMPPGVTRPLQLAEEQLSPAEMEWLRQMPITAQLDPITAVHARLDEPGRFEYIFTKGDANKNFARQENPISMQGHSHVPLLWEKNEDIITCYAPTPKLFRLSEDCKYVINVGSVGQPRDDNPDACYVIFDSEAYGVRYRRLPYDIEATQRRIREVGLPEGNALRLASGH